MQLPFHHGDDYDDDDHHHGDDDDHHGGGGHGGGGHGGGTPPSVLLPNGNYSIPHGAAISITLDSISSDAGYNNSFGHYFADSEGNCQCQLKVYQ